MRFSAPIQTLCLSLSLIDPVRTSEEEEEEEEGLVGRSSPCPVPPLQPPTMFGKFRYSRPDVRVDLPSQSVQEARVRPRNLRERIPSPLSSPHPPADNSCRLFAQNGEGKGPTTVQTAPLHPTHPPSTPPHLCESPHALSLFFSHSLMPRWTLSEAFDTHGRSVQGGGVGLGSLWQLLEKGVETFLPTPTPPFTTDEWRPPPPLEYI